MYSHLDDAGILEEGRGRAGRLVHDVPGVEDLELHQVHLVHLRRGQRLHGDSTEAATGQ